jgi:CheY-like chemotaxis protein
VKLDSATVASIDFFTGKLTPGFYIVLEVQDNGVGMDEATLTQILDPFFTTKFTGRGLGLSAVEGILRTHRGALELRTAVGLGSTFCVYLPAAPRRKHSARAPSTVKATGNGTVLVVDDEEMVRRITRDALERAGFKVREASGGEEAIELLKTKDTPISLILLDLSMPGMSGKQVMRRIRSLGIEIPILVSSGYSENEVFDEFSGLDIAGFVPKPFTAHQLVSRVSALLQSVLAEEVQ